MKKIILLFFALWMTVLCFGQSTYKLAVGANRAATSFILRNRMDNNLSQGLGVNLTLSKPGSSYRVTTQYTKYKRLDMDPVWKAVDAYKIESNFELVTHFDNVELLLYPFLGLSYNYISGLYTAKHDNEALQRFYVPNSIVTNNWLGLSCGVGLERTFFKHLIIFGNYRMHIVKAEVSIRIMDIGVDAGLKYTFDLKFKKTKKSNSSASPSPQIDSETKNKKIRFKKLKMPGKRYDLNQ